MKKQLCAVALLATTALGTAARADDFTYLSGGALYGKPGALADLNKVVENHASLTEEEKEACKLKEAGAGFYLNGSVGFDNNIFVEGRLNYSQKLSNYLLGAGYHYPVVQQVDAYALAGVSKRHQSLGNLLSMTGIRAGTISSGDQQRKAYKDLNIELQDSIQPTAEIGLKARLNDVAGVQAAYRLARFSKGALKEFLHEGRLNGYYKVTETLAVEAGYTYNTYSKSKLKDHVGQIGLRYTF